MARLAPAAGMAYALLVIFGSSFLRVRDAEPDDSAESIARRFVEARGQVTLGVLLILLGLFFFLVFLAWLHRWLRQVEGPSGWLATLALIGGVLVVASLSMVVLVSVAGTVLEDYGGDPVIARTVLVFQAAVAPVVFVPMAAFVGATSLLGLGGVLPRWLSYSGLAIALGLIAALLPFVLPMLWTGLLAAFLFQRSRGGRG
jgi:hypothetical protein